MHRCFPKTWGYLAIAQKESDDWRQRAIYRSAAAHPWTSVFYRSFFGRRPKLFWNDRKKLSHFGQNFWKYRVMNTVTASFNTTVRQMTEMSQRKKTALNCLLWSETETGDGTSHDNAAEATHATHCRSTKPVQKNSKTTVARSIKTSANFGTASKVLGEQNACRRASRDRVGAAGPPYVRCTRLPFQLSMTTRRENRTAATRPASDRDMYFLGCAKSTRSCPARVSIERICIAQASKSVSVAAPCLEARAFANAEVAQCHGHVIARQPSLERRTIRRNRKRMTTTPNLEWASARVCALREARTHTNRTPKHIAFCRLQCRLPFHGGSSVAWRGGRRIPTQLWKYTFPDLSQSFFLDCFQA